MVIIDPTQLTLEQSTFLGDFLDGEDEPELYLKDSCYEYDGIEFKLTHEINWRQGKDGVSDCFEVIADRTAGVGKNAQVDEVAGKLIFNNKGTLAFQPAEHKPHKERVRKLIPYNEQKDKAQWRHEIEQEYKRTKQSGHLHAHKPVFFKHKKQLSAYFFMRKALGKPLNQLMQDIEFAQLDTLTRQALSTAIIKAYIEQVKMPGLVHNDLSLNNIMVDLSNKAKPKVTFIDFAFAKKISSTSTDGPLRGTPIYMAPERLLSNISSSQSDVFALGHILAEIWGEQRTLPNPQFPIGVQLTQLYIQNNSGRFDSELIYLDESESTIKNTLELMIAPDPDKRPTPEQVHSAFLSECRAESHLAP